MALFEYFPNYIWNLSVAIAMESGAEIPTAQGYPITRTLRPANTARR